MTSKISRDKIHVVVLLVVALTIFSFLFSKIGNNQELDPIDIPNGYWKDAKAVYLTKSS